MPPSMTAVDAPCKLRLHCWQALDCLFDERTGCRSEKVLVCLEHNYLKFDLCSVVRGMLDVWLPIRVASTSQEKLMVNSQKVVVFCCCFSGSFGQEVERLLPKTQQKRHFMQFSQGFVRSSMELIL